MKTNQLQKNIIIGWKQTNLSDVSTKISDGLHTTPKYVDTSDYYFINGNNLVDDEVLIDSETKCVTKDEFLKHKKDLSERTILLSINGTIGSVALYNNEKVILGKSAAYINCLNGVNKKYIFNLLKTSSIKKYFEREVTGSTIKNLSIKSIKNLNFNCPDILEQNRIVSVLETWDKSIENLNKKIEIKKQIKKGLMQNLLTGKKRLSGFNDKWEIVMLGDICDIKTGKKDVNEGNPNGKYPFFTCAKDHTYSDEYSFDTEAILIAGNGEVGNCLYYKGKFEAYQRTYVLSNFKKESMYIYPYLKYFFQNIINSQKQMGAMPYIKLGMLQEFEVRVPKELKEQKEIANVLITTDKEIIDLERKLSIIKDQKKYLLNNLITGTIRTPENLSIKS